ncbi:hypothetical protein KEM56_000628 [Ascosphaera pollenicola]|nr:hypothetical protein KEM56_000628 [Ascosphaera pollenicola]
MRALRSAPFRLQNIPWRPQGIQRRAFSTPLTVGQTTTSPLRIALRASSQPQFQASPCLSPPVVTTTKATAAYAPRAQRAHLSTTAPPDESEKRGKHVLDCLVQDEPGVLTSIAPVLSSKGFNIETLAIGKSEFADVSRMTVMLRAGEDVPEDELGVAIRELIEDVRDLPSVWTAEIYSENNEAIVGDELLLVEVSVLGPEAVKKLHKGLEELNELEPLVRESRVNELSAGLSEVPQENLQENLQSLTRLTERFGGKILDTNVNTCVAELSAQPEEVDRYLRTIAPYGIIQSSRTAMALPRWPFIQSAHRQRKKKIGATMDDIIIPIS